MILGYTLIWLFFFVLLNMIFCYDRIQKLASWPPAPTGWVHRANGSSQCEVHIGSPALYVEP